MTIDKTLLEDVAYGIYDRPGPTGKIADEENQESTVPSDVPLKPSQHMTNQLSVQRPPIEDEEYIPASTEELSRAASAIAQLAPTSSIEYFYKRLHALLDDATDHAADSKKDADAAEDSEGVTPTVNEESIRREIRKLLKEELSSSDIKDYEDYRGADDFEEDDLEEPNLEMKTKSSGEMSLEDLAQEFGYSGPPGVRQELERLQNRLNYFATKVKEEDLTALTQYAVGEFIDVMEEADLVDVADIDAMRSSPSFVKDLDSFRYFFVSAFVMPAYRKVVRDATKKVKTEIDQLGIPKELQQTVFNQVTGASSSKEGVLSKKIDKLVRTGKLEKEEADKLLPKIQASKAALVAASDYSDDFIQTALDKWQASSKSSRVKALKQAMESTL